MEGGGSTGGFYGGRRGELEGGARQCRREETRGYASPPNTSLCLSLFIFIPVYVQEDVICALSSLWH